MIAIMEDTRCDRLRWLRGIEVKQSLNRGNISGGFKVIHFDSDLCAVTRELAVVL